MRELILTMSVTLDGFVSGPDGDIQWVFSGDQEAITWKVENMWNASLIIMGSRSFQDMAPFWPTSTMAFAPAMNQIPKAVFSKRGPVVLEAAAKGLRDARAQAGDTLQPGAESWAEAYVASGDLADEINKLKAKDGKPIIAIGGATFARSLIAQNLVDQYVLMIYPIALGKGLPIFSDLPAPRPLKLVSSKAFPLGAMAQTYRPA
ncbi:dihydrofolate reductase family protein [Dyella caseinilytica]|uniref:Dihydrofolate reductase family protein n=1 Tax=Dyella caseinilytica TaxID=1849581 RepID=A0ABX7GTX6_9GAMM|nr:dihydrofolate reductase family protein [Dyella caseinilytica]QRN53906.1 dihydrofolate reductase family protein [Dyella caseinilytica]GFZ90034.1 dihydrofolate reductase [Dyella caseinilytica]